MTAFILYVATSLDGYIARTDGRVDWLSAFESESNDHGYAEFYQSIDALVMGSVTYEQVLSFGDWVYAGKPTYVLTNRQLSSDREDVAFRNSVEAVIDDAKKFQRVWIVGGANLAASFAKKGLIHDYIIVVMPLILGSGISLYASLPEQMLQLVEAKPYPSGAVELRYKNAQKNNG